MQNPTKAEIDHILTAQILIAWAGEGGEEPRLNWWRTDLISEFGGEDLYQRLLPNTWQWATLQSAREAARRTDADIRKRDHNPDRILSLYALGFNLDERVEERFNDHKRSKRNPTDALPGLSMLQKPWRKQTFIEWIEKHNKVETVPALIGRRIRGQAPPDPTQSINRLIAGLAPLTDTYPLPHYWRES